MKILRRVKSRIRRELGSCIRRSSWYKEQFLDCAKFWKYGMYAPSAGFDLEVVNLGSTSGVCAFDYAGLPIHAENWALRHNPLSADVAILENYSSYLKSGATVIFPLCPFSTLAGSYAFQEDRYYTILNPRSIPSFSRRRLERILSVRDKPLSHYPLIEPVNAVRLKFRSWLRLGRSDTSSLDFETDAELWISSWLKEFGLDDFCSPLSLVNQDGIDDAVMYLKRAVAYCRGLGCQPVLTVPPMHRALARKFTLQARTLLIDSFISRIGDGVRFLNYLDDPEFTTNKSLFKNSFLLNMEGARKFTQRILSDLKLIAG